MKSFHPEWISINSSKEVDPTKPKTLRVSWHLKDQQAYYGMNFHATQSISSAARLTILNWQDGRGREENAEN